MSLIVWLFCSFVSVLILENLKYKPGIYDIKNTLSIFGSDSVFFSIDIQLIYNVVLLSGVQQSDSEQYKYTLFSRFFSISGCYKLLNIVPYAIEQNFIYLFYMQQCVPVNSKLLKVLFYPVTPASPFGNQSLFSTSVILFLFYK